MSTLGIVAIVVGLAALSVLLLMFFAAWLIVWMCCHEPPQVRE